MNTHSRFVRIIFPLLCGVALLLLAAPARAQIALVDNEYSSATSFNNTSSAITLSTNLTVSATANTLVVVLAYRDGATETDAPPTLSWTNASTTQTLTLAAQTQSKISGSGRGSAIYYLYNPTAGTGWNIKGSLGGQVGSSGDLVAYTLSGVDTTVVHPPSSPLYSGSLFQSDQAAGTSLWSTVNNIAANSWAAVSGVINETGGSYPLTAANSGTATGTPSLTTTTGGFSSASTAAMGYISTIAGGSDLFTFTFPSSASDAALAVAVFAPTNAAAIGIQPQNESAFSGGAATGVFTVAANGTSLTYQWYTTSASAGAFANGSEGLTNATALSNGNKYSGATGSTLMVSNVVAGDLTNYAVVVTGSSGSVTSSVVTLSSVPVGNQQGDVIGVAVTQSGYATVLNTDVAGAVPLTNWNVYDDITSWPVVQGTGSLQDNAAANTGAGLTMSGVNNGYKNTGSSVSSSSSPNAKLLFNALTLRANGYISVFTFTNLPAIGNYDVYVYISGQDNSDQLQVQCLNNGVSYYQEAPPGVAVTNNQALVLGNNTTVGTYPGCNYVVFGGVTPVATAAGNVISFTVNASPLSDDNGGLSGVQLVPSGTTFLGFIQQPQAATIAPGQNTTFSGQASGNPAVTSYQWYEISGGATNPITGATSSSYTTNGATAVNASYFVVAGNGSVYATSSVATLTMNIGISGSGVWNTSSGSWTNPASWLSSNIASGVGTTAWFVNDQGGTITLDNSPGYTVGTNVFGITGATSAQPSWTINAGSPAGTLTMSVSGTASVTAGSPPTVTAVPMIEVYPNNPITINAPLAGTQGLNVVGGGTLVLAGGNTNNTYTGKTVIGNNNSTDTSALQIGNGGSSGAIDFTHTIYMSALAELIFDLNTTTIVSTTIDCKGGKAPNVIVNDGTVVMAPSSTTDPYLGAIVNNGGTLVLDCSGGATFVNNTGGTVNPTNGTPNLSSFGNGGNATGVSLGINSGGLVQLTGAGGNNVNIQNNNGVLDNGVFDLGGDNVELGLIIGSGIVTNSGSTLVTLNLAGGNGDTPSGFPLTWGGTIADGTSAKTAVTLSGGTTTFTGANTYSGSTLLSGGSLVLSNSASLNSANIYVASSGSLILANTATITNSNAAIYIGSGRTMGLTGLSGGYTLNAGQTLVVTNTGVVSAGANTFTAASGSTLVPGGYGTAGTMNMNANLALNGNTNVFDLSSSTGSGNDQITGVTNLTLSGNITIVVNTNFNNTFTPASTYNLIHYSGTLANTATFTVVPSTLVGNPVTISTATANYLTLYIAGNAPPVITTTTNIDGFTGYPVTLSASVTGSIPITNQWYNGASPVANATNLTYTFTPATAGVYTYTLWVTNAYGKTNATVTVNVGSPTISVQCALATSYFSGSLYLASTDTAGVYAVSNWNVITITPSSGTAAGITQNNVVDYNGFATPATFTAVNVQDGWHDNSTITSADTANARFMQTYWFANPAHTPSENTIQFTVTNLPNDGYDVYVYLIEATSPNPPNGGDADVYSGTYTNYIYFTEDFSSSSNFFTATNLSPLVSPPPTAVYVELRIPTGGSNSIAFNVTGTGVPGVQIVPAQPPVAATMTSYRTAGLPLEISLSDVATNWSDGDGFTPALAGINLVTTNGVNLTTNASWIFYTNSPNVNDQISYTITDGEGKTNTGLINISIVASVTGTNSITGITIAGPPVGGSNTVTAYGIPGYQYVLQRATNLTPVVYWQNVSTNTASSINGLINATDYFTDFGEVRPSQAYYRLSWTTP